MRRHVLIAAGAAASLVIGSLASAAQHNLPPVRHEDGDRDEVRDYTPRWEPNFLSLDGLAPVNHNVTNRSGAQSETATAVDPTNSNHIITFSNDLSSTAGVFESFDGGNTWTRSTFGSAGFCYDPWVTFNNAGDVFLGYECSNQSVAYKNAGSGTWVAVNGLSIAGSFPDRDMIVADRSLSSPYVNSVYIGYDDNGSSNTAYVLYSRTGKGASSWSRSARINDSGPTIGVNACVGPDGSVYTVWEEYGARKIWTDKSTNGGASWGTDHLVTNYRMNTTSFFVSIPPQNRRGIVPMAFSACAQSGPWVGRLYCVYTDNKTTGSQTGIFLRYSDNGGTTWSAEKFVSNNPQITYAFHPTVAVLSDGTVGVNFNATGGAASHKVRHVLATSIDGGDNFTLAQIADGTSDETGSADANQYGDYQNIGADNGTHSFSIVWTDSRPGNLAEEMYWASQPAAAAPSRTLAGKGGAQGISTNAVANEPYVVNVARTNGALGFAHLNFRLAEDGFTRLSVIDATGRVVDKVMDGFANAGEYSIPFNGRDADNRPLSNGVYFYRFESNGHQSSGKIVIAR
jgi:hypothetical protein